jgi:heptosyltransferase-2
MIWHMPHIRAIAAYAGAPITLIAKPRSLADQLLADDKALNDIFWVDINPGGRKGAHDGVRGLFRLVRKLRSREFGTIIMLHHSHTLAMAAWMAGIPDRRGYGWGGQRRFLTQGPYLPADVGALHQHTRATRYLSAAGIALPDPEPHILVPEATRIEARSRLGSASVRFVAIGIGSSEPLRQWGAERFARLTKTLLDAGWPMIVLVGGKEDLRLTPRILSGLGAATKRVKLALGWHLRDVSGMLAEADFYIGNNTGVMNMAAATGVRTYALFGTTAPFAHASQIVPVTCPDTGVHDGMLRLTVENAIEAIRHDRGRLGP